MITPADILLSAGIFAAFLPYIYHHDHFYALAALGVPSAAVLLAKKRYPLTTLAACLALTGAIAVLRGSSYPTDPPNLVSLYAVGRYRARGLALVTALATAAFGFAAAQLIDRIPSYGLTTVGQLALVPFAVLAGAWVRTQRMYVIAANERAERAEREREEEARRRVAEERVHIARELHDIVGHALMSISVLSSAGARLVDRDAKAGREALETISSLSNSALMEIRTTLSLLRESTEPLTWPQHGLADLPELIAQARKSGLPVELNESGTRPSVPAIIGTTVYRIVQESLTNVARHGRDVTRVAVSLDYTPDDLGVTVANDGRPCDTRTEAGIDIRGMRERVTATGGRLDTRRLPTGGFRVHARLPLKEAAR